MTFPQNESGMTLERIEGKASDASQRSISLVHARNRGFFHAYFCADASFDAFHLDELILTPEYKRPRFPS